MSDTSHTYVEGVSAFVRADTLEEAVKAARRIHHIRLIATGKVLYSEDFGDGTYEVVLQRLLNSRVKPVYSCPGTTNPVLVGYKQVAM